MKIKKYFFLIVTFCQLFSGFTFADGIGPRAQAARDLCRANGDSTAQMILNIDNSICELAFHSTLPRVPGLARSVLGILEHLPPDEDVYNNRQLRQAMTRLNRALDDAQNRNRPTVPENPIAQMFANITADYGTQSLRQRNLRTVAQKRQYAIELLQVAANTNSGRQIIECYKNTNSPLINSVNSIEDIVNTFNFSSDGDGYAQFAPVEAPAGSAKPFSLSITVTNMASNSPDGQLELLMHEMQHGCQANNFAGKMQNLSRCSHNLEAAGVALPERTNSPENTTGTLFEYTRANAEFYRTAAVDEMRAYGRAAEVMLELTEAWPQNFCSRLASDVFSRNFRVGGSPSLWGEIVDGMNNGTEIFEDIMERYVDIGSQVPEYVYVMDAQNQPVRAPGSTRPTIAPALMQQFLQTQATWR